MCCAFSLSCVLLFATPWDESIRHICPRDSPGKNTGVVFFHALLQGIFPTQGSNPGLPHCRWGLYQLSYQGSIRQSKYSHTISFHHSLVAQWLGICLQYRRPRFDPWVRKIPWRRKRKPTPVLLPGGAHGQRSLVGYSPWGHKEEDTIE